MGISVRLIVLAVLVCARPSLSHAFSYASDVPQQQQWIMEGDLRYLERVPGTLSSPFLVRTLKHDEIGSGHLQAWLEGRMKIVTASRFQLKLEVARTNADSAVQGGPRILMTNFGGPIYVAGKARSIFYSVDIPGHGKILVNSPRVGLVRVTEALFQPLFRDSSQIDSSAHAIFRLHNYFHEARHSDGNGESLTMPHVQCPVGHVYENRYACDAVVNGAYRVGSEVVKSLAEKCTDCTEQEKDLLSIFHVDEVSRILNLRLEKKESELCAMVRNWGKSSSYCEEESTDEGPLWDDRGEVAR